MYFQKKAEFNVVFLLLCIIIASLAIGVVNNVNDTVSNESSKSNVAYKVYSQSIFTGFLENKGQYDNPEIFYYYSQGDSLFGFGESKIFFYKRIYSNSTENSNFNRYEYFVMSLKSSELVNPTGYDKLRHKTNYFKGNKTFTELIAWKEIYYYNIYDKIDLRYFITEQGLNYEFIVKPGGNPESIILKASENIKLQVEKEKVSYIANDRYEELLFVDTGIRAYERDGNIVDAKFGLSQKGKNSIHFEIGVYDKKKILTINPLFVDFSINIGGTSRDYGTSIAVDEEGNSYTTGFTYSADFPTKNAYNRTFGGNWDVFILKMNDLGTEILFSTFIGGIYDEIGTSIAIDYAGNSYVTGYTYSGDFPTKNALDNTRSGRSDIFVLKLNVLGNELLYSTFIGGSNIEEPSAIEIDDEGNSYVTGYTTSPDFPLINALYSTRSGYSDVFLLKLNLSGTNLIFSTLIGGSSDDYAEDLAIDLQGNIYLTGYTRSSNFPLNYSINTVVGDNSDIFILKLNSEANQIVFSSLIGGSQTEEPNSIVVDKFGQSYVTGETSSRNFPTRNTNNSTLQGYSDVFVLKLNANGSKIDFSTIIGGSDDETGYDIAIDNDGNYLVVGFTYSIDFPVKNSIFDFNKEMSGEEYIGFVLKINAVKKEIEYNTFIGKPNTLVRSLDMDDDGNIYIAGISAVDTSGQVFILKLTNEYPSQDIIPLVIQSFTYVVFFVVFFGSILSGYLFITYKRQTSLNQKNNSKPKSFKNYILENCKRMMNKSKNGNKIDIEPSLQEIERMVQEFSEE